jgi:hypothetical protein
VPRMHREELAQFLKLLECSHRYLEFGMGAAQFLPQPTRWNAYGA